VRRFLLFAECQIGKTGTYLALLLFVIAKIKANAVNPRLWTPNPKPGTRNPQSVTLNPKSQTLE